MLANDISAIAADMIRCFSFKIPSPLFQIKYKTGLNRESIAMFNATLAVGLYFGSIELNLVSEGLTVYADIDLAKNFTST